MNYMKKYNEWITNSYFEEDSKNELLSIQNNKKEIEDRFYKDLEFGTGGLRGIIGAGSNRMNKYTVRRVTLGLGNYILKKCGEEGKVRGVVIAYDSRHKSKEFCIESAKTLAYLGIKAFIFDELKSTPQLSFAVRHLNAMAGIVITASHNPPEYNGYKVYWEDGAQVTPQTANEIIEEVNKINDYSKISVMKEETAKENKLINTLSKEIDDLYIKEVKKQSLRSDIVKEISNDFKMIYTPLNGTGNKPVKRILKEIGFKNIYVVSEQENPDPNFTTVKYPNPEEKDAFKLSIELAKKKDAHLIIGTDPDCDRVGVVVKNKDEEYVVLTGNQIGALLINYILKHKKEKNDLPKDGVVVKTIVTSKMGEDIARSYGMYTVDTLTGFKYIGEKIKEFEENKERSFIFGYEESYGYLAGTHARDKDGVVASMLIAEMAAYYHSKGMSLYDALVNLYENYGYYKEDLKSATLEGKEGLEKIQDTMNYFRENPIDKIGKISIAEIKDYKNGIDNLPKENVIKYILDNECWFALRPSGTEPKIKFYFGAKGNSAENVKDNLNSLINEVMYKVYKVLR